MKKTPYPKQIEGATYLSQRGSGFLWMEMRTGKTLTALMGRGFHTDHAHDRLPCLILAPVTPLLGWYDELLDLGVAKDRICFVVGSKEKRRNLLLSPSYDYYLLNYDVLADLDAINIRYGVPFLRNWYTIIFDESYCISTTTPKFQPWDRDTMYKVSARTQYTMDSAKYIPSYQNRIALSGLPNPESSLNFAPQYFAVDGHYMGYQSFEDYMNAKWVYDKWKRKWKPVHPHHETSIMEYVQQNSYMCTMKEANPDTGGLLFSIWDIPITSEQEVLFRWLDGATMYHKKGEDPLVDDPHPLLPVVKFTFGILIACGIHPITKEPIPCNKNKYLLQWYKERKEKAVVLSYSVKALEMLAEDLTKAGVSYVMVTGSTPKPERGVLRERFQNGEVDFFLGQSTTVMMGYDLSLSDYIFYLSNDCSNNVRTQANMRGMKATKNTPVEIIDICAAGTREREIVPLLNGKYEDARKFIEQPNVSFYVRS